MVLRSPGGWGLSLALVFVCLVQGVDPAPLDDWAHDDTQLSFPTEGKSRNLYQNCFDRTQRYLTVSTTLTVSILRGLYVCTYRIVIKYDAFLFSNMDINNISGR